MITVSYDAEHDAVVIEFKGNVDAPQAERALADLAKLLPEGKGGFMVLTDYTGVGAMEPEVEGAIVKTMEFFNARGVTDVVRVLPNPDWDFGFSILSRAHYSKRVAFHVLRTRKEAETFIRRAARARRRTASTR